MLAPVQLLVLYIQERKLLVAVQTTEMLREVGLFEMLAESCERDAAIFVISKTPTRMTGFLITHTIKIPQAI